MKQFIDKLIERLEEEKKGHLNLYCDGLTKAISIINQLAEEFATDINVGNKLQTIDVSELLGVSGNDGWIPCSERLPEKIYGEYLCCDKWGNYIVGFPRLRISSGDYYVETDSELMNDCVAWRELPAPYQPKGQAND